MNEKKESYMPPEVKFAEQIENRQALWISIVRESNLDDETKNKLSAVLDEFKKTDFNEPEYKTSQRELYDLFRSVIGRLLNSINHDDPEQNAVFENLKADLWKFCEKLEPEN